MRVGLRFLLRFVALTGALCTVGAIGSLGSRTTDDPFPMAPIRGLDPVEVRLEWKQPSDMDEDATRRCLVYAHYAVLGTYGNFMGDDNLELRARPQGMSAAEVCADDFVGHSVLLQHDVEVCAVGLFDRYLVGLYPDGFGILGAFSLFDVETGGLAYRDEFELLHSLEFERTSEGPSLTYWSQVADLDCIPRRGESECWKRIRANHGIPAAVAQPDCGCALDQSADIPETEANASVQITVRVRVPRLSRRDATYLAERAHCGVPD